MRKEMAVVERIATQVCGAGQRLDIHFAEGRCRRAGEKNQRQLFLSRCVCVCLCTATATAAMNESDIVLIVVVVVGCLCSRCNSRRHPPIGAREDLLCFQECKPADSGGHRRRWYCSLSITANDDSLHTLNLPMCSTRSGCEIDQDSHQLRHCT